MWQESAVFKTLESKPNSQNMQEVFLSSDQVTRKAVCRFIAENKETLIALGDNQSAKSLELICDGQKITISIPQNGYSKFSN